MGIDLQVTLPHTLDASAVARLPEFAALSSAITRASTDLHSALASRWSALPPVADFAALRWSDSPPTANSITALWAAHQAPGLEWAAFAIYVGRHAIVMTHIEKFGAFLDRDVGLQRPLRVACRAFAAVVGADAAIYAADSYHPTELTLEWTMRGMTFDSIVLELGVRVGPASAEIANCERDVDGARSLSGWYLDRFEELA